MKIRIKGNSIRYRLTKSDVDTFTKTGKCVEQTNFNSQTFTYVLEALEGLQDLQADFIQNTITIYIPKEAQQTWQNSNRVGYSNKADWNDPNALSILVEKDFTCLDNTIEDQTDNYANPRLAK